MSSFTEAVDLAKELINIESITPNDNNCQDILINQLQEMGFDITPLPSNGVSNFWAQRNTAQPLLVFSGHTDVVPPGPLNKWRTDPFTATVDDGYLYGRGAADMKGALAAMVVGVKEFIKEHPEHQGSIGFIITSDEEGDATDGTKKVVEYLQEQNIHLDWCLIGEASSNVQLGDAIKIGRRGSLHGRLQVIGKQGHIAYPQLAENPIHRSFKALDILTHTEWDQGNDFFSPTSFQIYKINADTGATNVIPGSLTARFNFRFSPASHAEELKDRVHKVFDDHELNYKINWTLMSEPFLSERGQLTEACIASIKDLCQLDTHPNTTGGTSDGRFIAPMGCEVVELGAISQCIHQVNEHIKTNDLEKLAALYCNILKKLLGENKKI